LCGQLAGEGVPGRGDAGAVDIARMTKLSEPLWNSDARTLAACTDCSEAASNPPWESFEATLPPKNAATMTKSPVTTTTPFRWAPTLRARRRRARSIRGGVGFACRGNLLTVCSILRVSG
jgi:hypothetical protein